MRALPIGVQDFKAIRDSDKCFVDKSMLIGQMLDTNDNGVFLYTRPRRFGKSLNLSMIDAFFNIEYKDNKWFEGLKITDHPEYDRYKNAYPVISVDLRFGDITNFDKFVEAFNLMLFDIFNDFRYIRDSPLISEESKTLFTKLYAGEKTVTESENALTKLCSMLREYHDSKVIVLIDEYDNAVNSITDTGLRQQILSFLREMMSSLLKGNRSLQMGIVTGVMQITKENIFSGLNNLSVNNVLSKEFDEMFGFTDDEVKQICADYGHPEKFEEAKDWYDGYRFGNADIYNPWSILNYIQKGFEPVPYWVNTSGNSIINDLIRNADDGVLKNLKMLGSGEGIEHDVFAAMTFEELSNDPEAIYSLMVVSGYLKAIPYGNKYILKIPNRELYSVFSDVMVRAVFSSNASDLKDFTDTVLANDTKAMEKALYALIVNTLSSRVLDNEHSYQAFIAGLLMTLSGRYKITADFENGQGYYDIRMESRSGIGCNAVIEIKRSKREGDCENDAKDAIQQIKDNDYAHGLKGNTVLYGIAFFKKTPYIVSEVL